MNERIVIENVQILSNDWGVLTKTAFAYRRADEGKGIGPFRSARSLCLSWRGSSPRPLSAILQM